MHGEKEQEIFQVRDAHRNGLYNASPRKAGRLRYDKQRFDSDSQRVMTWWKMEVKQMEGT